MQFIIAIVVTVASFVGAKKLETYGCEKMGIPKFVQVLLRLMTGFFAVLTVYIVYKGGIS